MKFLVTGGSGFLGINIIRYLLKKNHEVVNLDVVPFDYKDCKNLITSVTGDIRNKSDIEKAIQNVDQVIHCAAALPLYKPEDIYSTDIDGTRNLLEASEKFGVKRFIHISSTAVYGIPDHHPLLETDELIGVGAYGEAKILAEEECLKFRKKNMCVPILRPKSFIGPNVLAFLIFYMIGQKMDTISR